MASPCLLFYAMFVSYSCINRVDIWRPIIIYECINAAYYQGCAKDITKNTGGQMLNDSAGFMAVKHASEKPE